MEIYYDLDQGLWVADGQDFYEIDELNTYIETTDFINDEEY